VRRRLDAVVGAPRQVRCTLRSGICDVDHGSAAVQVLDGTRDLDVNDARLFADDMPGVDVTFWFIDVGAGSDTLARAQLSGALKVECVNLTGVVMEGDGATWFQAHQF
jgi:hypothetical protein